MLPAPEAFASLQQLGHWRHHTWVYTSLPTITIEQKMNNPLGWRRRNNCASEPTKPFPLLRKMTAHHRSTFQFCGQAMASSYNKTAVDEHAKLKTQLKTKHSSQPRAASPTCVSRVTWGPTQVSWIPDESHKRSHNDNRPKGSHVRGIPRPRNPTSIQNNRTGDQRLARN